MAPISKRRKLDDQPAAITFDPSARQEYLTGFHKRKVARKENAREQAQKRDKEERVSERKLLRQQRREDLDRHVAEFNAELRKMNPDIEDTGSDDEAAEDGAPDAWEGIEEQDAAQEDEYVDEDKFTTVTVEAMGGPTEEDPEELAHKQRKIAEGEEAKKKAAAAVRKRPWLGPDGKPKPKKKKFRYESKAERSMTRKKQKTKNQAAKAKRESK